SNAEALNDMTRRVGPGSFVGRRTELESIEGLLDRSVGGSGAWVLVEGEPGIGKSRLLEEVVNLADKRGSRVHTASADALDADRPFGLFVDALGLRVDAEDEDRAQISDLLYGPAAAAAPLTGVTFQLVERVCDLVEKLAATVPLLVALEDLHWADPS